MLANRKVANLKIIFILFLLLTHWGLNANGQWLSTTNYATTTTYNVDGDITSLSRNSTSNFDNLTYNFNDATHQLNHADDAKTASVYGYDIADQASDNYRYDASGNILSNTQDALTITYNSLGKIEKITKSTGETTIYTYDATGNKIKKVHTSPSGEVSTTYYFLDALGKEINVYESTTSASDIKSLEANINGAEQEGSIANSSTTTSYTSSTNIYTRALGKKSFYYKDHLGSIRTTYTDNTKTEKDKKLAVATCENTYPYGMAQPLRTYNSTKTRKGFQGKKAENALASNKTVLDFGARYNDTRLGLWLSVDPLDYKYPSVNPYNSMGNNPINFTDPDGKAVQTVDHEAKTITISEVIVTKNEQDYDKALEAASIVNAETGKWIYAVGHGSKQVEYSIIFDIKVINNPFVRPKDINKNNFHIKNEHPEWLFSYEYVHDEKQYLFYETREQDGSILGTISAHEPLDGQLNFIQNFGIFVPSKIASGLILVDENSDVLTSAHEILHSLGAPHSYDLMSSDARYVTSTINMKMITQIINTGIKEPFTIFENYMSSDITQKREIGSMPEGFVKGKVK